MKNPLRILLLEDCFDDAVLIERELKKAGIVFTPLIVQLRDEFEAALSDFRPDVILCDHSLPQFNSIEAFKIYKKFQSDTGFTVPFILVTGNVSEEFAVQSFKSGVDDYILKDRLKRLPLSIESALEKCEIERERMKYLQQVIVKEALMNEAEQLAQFCSWQSDLVTGKLTWSDAAYNLYGFEPGEIDPFYEDFFKLVHPDDIESLKRSHADAIQNQVTAEYDFRIIDRKGQLKYIGCKLQVHRDKDGRAIRLVGFNLDVTRRKESKMALEKSEQEYKSLFDQNPDPVISLDLEGKFTKVNKGLEELTGISGDELRGMDFRKLLHPGDLERVYGHFRAALEGSPQAYEARLINRAGGTVILNVTSMPIVVNGEIIGVHGVGKDITEKRTLEDLLEQAHRFARIGDWELDMVNEKVTWSAITKELHEVPSDFEPTYEVAVQFFKEGKSRDDIRKAVERCRTEGRPWDLELQIITGLGNTRWVRSTGEAEEKNGKCIRMFGTFHDIHNRKEAEEVVKEAYEEKVAILESIGDGFFALDKTWTVTYWNAVAEKLLRMPRKNVLGKNLWDIYPDAVDLAFYTQYHRAMEERRGCHFEEFYPTLDMWFEVNVYPSRSGISVYFKDVTLHKKRIEEIESQNKQLKEIAWIQSHEMRGPLARMMGLVNILKEGMDEDSEFPQLLSDIQKNADELDALVRKIVRKTEEMGPKGAQSSPL